MPPEANPYEMPVKRVQGTLLALRLPSKAAPPKRQRKRGCTRRWLSPPGCRIGLRAAAKLLHPAEPTWDPGHLRGHAWPEITRALRKRAPPLLGPPQERPKHGHRLPQPSARAPPPSPPPAVVAFVWARTRLRWEAKASADLGFRRGHSAMFLAPPPASGISVSQRTGGGNPMQRHLPARLCAASLPNQRDQPLLTSEPLLKVKLLASLLLFI